MNTKSFGMALLFVILCLFFIKVFDISYPLKINITNTSQELAVVGEGKVDVIPDTAYVDVGITVNNLQTVEEARNKIDEINTQLIGAIKKLGIPSKEIKTTNYSVYPTYTYENNKNRITGYDGNATVTVKTKKTDTVPLIIKEATKAGANQINNTRFVVDDPAAYREEARGKAIANARDQAEKLAKSLGIKLGKVINVVESISGGQSSMDSVVYAKMSSAGGMGGVPTLESGSETVTSTVTLYFEKR
ncbi:MAG: SIMPL domain-containing protein [bacterium]